VTRREDTEALIYKVALLRYIHGRTPAQITKAVGKSKAHVFRLLAQAEEMKIVRRSVFAPRSLRLELEIVERVVTHPRWRGRKPDVQVVPSADAEGDTSTAIGFAVAAKLDALAQHRRLVAIGGSKAMLVAARNVERRRSGPGVVPTSLQQAIGLVEEANSQLVATILAERWNGLATHYSRGRAKGGGLYLAMLGVPPTHSVDDLARWHRGLSSVPGFAEVRRAWREVDVAVVGVASLTDDALYKSTQRLTGGAKAIRARGGVAMFARRCITADGSVLPLVEGTRLLSADPAIPIEKLRQLAQGAGEVVLVARGTAGAACAAVFAGRLATSLVCDEVAAVELLKAWDGVLGLSPKRKTARAR
jgi:DNA-binding transcriptional regulator LsrR (DeoR family)